MSGLSHHGLLAVLALLLSTVAATCPRRISFVIGSVTQGSPPSSGAGVTLAALQAGVLATTLVIPPLVTGEDPTYAAIAPSGELFFGSANKSESEGGTVVGVQFMKRPPFVKSVAAPAGEDSLTHISVLPCFSGRYGHYRQSSVVTVSYNGATVRSLIRGNGGLRLADTFKVPAELASLATDRQEAPHPHMALPYLDGVLVPDLGSDIVWKFAVSRDGALTETARVGLQKGDGPRHAIVHPTSGTVYLLTELSLAVVVMKESGCGDGFAVCARSPLVDDPASPAGGTAAAIRASADGKFLYASVRYPDEIPGVIVAYRLDVDTGDILEKVGAYSSLGVHPRDFFLVEGFSEGEDCVSFLAIANRDSDSVVLVKRDMSTGELASEASYELAVSTPMSVLQS